MYLADAKDEKRDTEGEFDRALVGTESNPGGAVGVALADPTAEQDKGCCGSADYQHVSVEEIYALAGMPMPGTPEPSDEAATFDSLVAKEAVKIKVREAARELVDAHKRPPVEPFDAGLCATCSPGHGHHKPAWTA